MYELIHDWVTRKIGVLNTPTILINEIDTTLDTNFLPASLKDKTYIIKLGETSFDDTHEDIEFDVKVIIEFEFLLAKQQISNYQNLIDNILYQLGLILFDNTKVPFTASDNNNLSIYNISKFDIKGLDKLDKTGTYLLPSMEFNLSIMYK